MAVAQKIVVFGDSQAQGLAQALTWLVRKDGHYKIINRTKPGTGLSQSKIYDWYAAIDHVAQTDCASIAVMMFGGNDWMPLRDTSGHWIRFGSEKWEDSYLQRVLEVCTKATAKGLRVIWVGDPISRKPTYNDAMMLLNHIYRTAATMTGSTYLDIWSVVSDEAGNFATYGKALNGETKRLRTDDGIHFTTSGYQLLASRVLRFLQDENDGYVLTP